MLMCLLACVGPRDGTAVGNPGNAGMTGTEMPDGVGWDYAEADVKSLRVVKHGQLGREVVIPVQRTIDLLAPAQDLAPLPLGVWDRIELELYDEGLFLQGEVDGGVDFRVTLDPEVLSVDGRFTVQGNERLIVAVPLSDALDLDTIEYAGQSSVRIDADHPTARDWSATVRETSQLWLDEDADGLPTDQDRQLAGPSWLAQGKAHSRSSAGCGSAPGAAALGVAFLAALTARRRRRPSA